MDKSNDEYIMFDQKKYFRRIRELGKGGFGKTYLVEDTTTDSFFAIKKYEPSKENKSAEDYKRFVNEVKIMFQLSHPNIVRVYSHYLYPDYKTGYILMEYIDGMTIDQFCPSEDKNWNDIFLETLRAFKYLEENGILHRDIRMANIMVDKDNNIKIIDFGFGKRYGTGNSEENANSVILNWLPQSKFPEEIAVNQDYTKQSEIYFLGKLFEALIHDDSTFRYFDVVEKMTKYSFNERYHTFSEILLEYSNTNSIIYEFDDDEKMVYQMFSQALHGLVGKYTDYFSYESDSKLFLDSLSDVVRKNGLENIIQNNAPLISSFITCSFRYYTNRHVDVKIVVDFYNFLKNSDDKKKQIIIENLANKLSAIPIESISSDDLPF